MKVRVIEYLNVRIGKPSVNAPTYQYIAPGSELEVEETFYNGDSFEGNNKWLKDGANNYYWAGGLSLDSPSIGELTNKKSFDWFKQLNIEKIWSAYNEMGENVTVAVLDTGFSLENKDLFSAVVKTNVFINYVNAPKCNNISDKNGHGTRCASIIGARNDGDYSIGIAPKCKLIIGKISCNREIRESDSIINGIQWAIENGADIISISYGINFSTVELKKIFEDRLIKIVEGKRILIFASAGNNSDKNPAFGENYPASFASCISIGSTDDDKFSPLTLQSAATIIHAPGVNIESYGLEPIPTPETGTSFSTPIVAGIVALVVSYYKKKNNGNWSPNEIMKIIYSTSPLLIGNKKKIDPLAIFKKLT